MVALHVHHGLSPNADAWLDHARRTCAAWARAGRPVSLRWARLSEAPPRGASVEAWARDARYAALERLARDAGATLVLLAHHRRDQAETVLLQALRGAGVAGLAAMPAQQRRGGRVWARPWLDQGPGAIAAYVRRHRLRHVEDESNHDPRWARSRLRQQVWPTLAAAFPQAEAMLARTARWMGQAEAALAAQAAADGGAAPDRDDPDRDALDGDALDRDAHDAAVAETPAPCADLRSWRDLPPARARQALRAWLRAVLGRPAPATLVERLMAEALPADHGQWPAPGGVLRLARGRLAWQAVAPLDGQVAAQVAPAARTQPVAPHLPAWPGTGPRRLRLPGWAGAWVLQAVSTGGLAWNDLLEAEARPRCGGEAFQAGPGRPPRALKKQYQAAGVDRWHRDGPLLWCGDRLLAVPGLGVDARAGAAAGVRQVALHWLADPADEER